MEALSFLTPFAMNIKTKMCWQCNDNKPKFIPATGPRLKTSGKFSARAEILNNKREIAASSTPQPLREQIMKQLDKGILMENGLVFRQNFTVRSFEIGIDSKISLGTLTNYLQETSLNHQKGLGLLADGFGSSPKLIPRDLIWVVCWSRIEVDRYPSWGDVIQVDTWKYRSGKSGYGCNWHIRDFNTGKTLMRATSLYVMMNKKTRRFAKIDEEIEEELKPCTTDCDPILPNGNRKILKLDIDNADHVRTGLMPGWTDMDINQHVSHIKLLNYVLEGVPRSVIQSHELSEMFLEYRNECNGDSELQSLSKVISKDSNDLMGNEIIEFDHLLRLECGQEIVRGRTTWKPKFGNIA